MGVPVDLAQAARLFHAAAAAGDAVAAYNLGMMYLQGQGVGRDPVAARRLLGQAAEGGVAHAFAALGDLLAELGQDRQAREHYVRAAEEGLPAAMWAAGGRLRDGLGGPADPVGAVRWFLRMLDHGDGDGVHEAIQLARGMTDAQIREAAGLAGRPADGEVLIGIVRREGT
ncbi:tetratricopeptide repeat protein [Nonomuraea sp. NPDC049480]|uniref:tetratricopeptide repeat protein n=1 Tax=Nonomuraea sp. NPDC049480 TaxID=3364353 RepID=UPI00379CC0D5